MFFGVCLFIHIWFLLRKASQTEQLREQLEQLKEEQASLLRAELAAAQAVWTKDKEQEISSLLARCKEQEQRRLSQAVLRTKEDCELQRKELQVRCEAELQQALREREERWRGQLAETEQTRRQQAREGFLAELEACLAAIREQPHRGSTGQWEAGGAGRSGPPQDAMAQIVQSSYRDLISKAVCQAKKEWDKVSFSIRCQNG